MNNKIRKDILFPYDLVISIQNYSKEMGLNFTSSCIVLLRTALNMKKTK